MYAHKLDILVTHYMEPSAIVRRFLDSLGKQTYKDFKVTIVDDGLDCTDIDISGYDFEIEHLKFQHHTVSKARNNAFDNTNGEHFMFCDCDDVFDDTNIQGLERAMLRMTQNDLDVYATTYYAETWKKNLNEQLSSLLDADNNGDVLVKVNAFNRSTVHSKIFKRKFITENNIRFIDDLWMNEDSAFVDVAWNICDMTNGKTLKDCETFYIWKYNAKSTTRTNKDIYPILGYDQFVTSFIHGLRKFIDILQSVKDSDRVQTLNNELSLMILENLFQGYYWLYLNTDRFKDHPKFNSCLEADIEKHKELYYGFHQYVSPKTYESEAYKKYVKRFIDSVDEKTLAEKLPFDEWLKNTCEAK